MSEERPEEDLGGKLPETATESTTGFPGSGQLGARVGMFGVRGSGDTSGYGGLLRQPVLPTPVARPWEGWFEEVAAVLDEAVTPTAVVHRGELTLLVRREDLPTVARLLRDSDRLRFELCAGVSGVHYPDQQGAELHAVYHLLSMTYNRRVRLEVSAPDTDPHVPSLVSVYPTLDWHERETYDMFGLIFDGHPGLTRILMPDDWPGHPQRKDYPLGGIPVDYHGATVPPPDQRRSYT
jgi:NADH-quinone oxidoreductase subunit C